MTRRGIWYFVNMRRMLVGFIVAGLITGIGGCRTDAASKASSDFDKSTGSPAPTPIEASQRQVKDDRPLIVCFGDSLTAGYGADEGESYPDFLQKDITKDGFRYRVVNAGVSGNTTKDGVDRLASVIAMHPAIVVLEFGGNDGLRGLKVETTRNNLSQMIARLKVSGAKVIVAGITLPPDYGPDYVKNFTSTYPTLARKYSVPVIPFILQDVYGVDGMMQPDGIHATDKGNEIVAQNVLSVVVPLLHK
jgi:acyl-CoA thioesterase-1